MGAGMGILLPQPVTHKMLTRYGILNSYDHPLKILFNSDHNGCNNRQSVHSSWHCRNARLSQYYGMLYQEAFIISSFIDLLILICGWAQEDSMSIALSLSDQYPDAMLFGVITIVMSPSIVIDLSI
jgi:hypothetical protein